VRISSELNSRGVEWFPAVGFGISYVESWGSSIAEHNGRSLGFRKTSPETLNLSSFLPLSWHLRYPVQFARPAHKCSRQAAWTAEILNCVFSSSLRSKFKLTDVAVYIERHENGPRSSAQSLSRLGQTGIWLKHSNAVLTGQNKMSAGGKFRHCVEENEMKWTVQGAAS
jgi:hypothetical protein